jgi:hypothetical protein
MKNKQSGGSGADPVFPKGAGPKNHGTRWQWIVLLTASLITLWILVLHGLFLFNAGPLWRDEAGTVAFATMPAVKDIWQNLRYDNFPLLFVALARLWSLLGWNSDFGFRVFGFIIGTGTLGVLWWGARKMGGKAPLLALAMYACTPMAIRVGDAMRPYGLGIALNLLTVALIWCFAQTPGRRTLICATLAAILSVQCLYQNAFFIIASSCGAWSVTILRRQWKAAWQIGIIGLMAALSLLPYYGIIKAGRDWRDISQEKHSFTGVCGDFYHALQVPGAWMAPIWLAILAIAIAVAIFSFANGRNWTALYCVIVLGLSLALQLVVLWQMAQLISLWYFLILMAPAALMMDAILGNSTRWQWQLGCAAISFILAAACIPVCQGWARMRQSNIDLIAAKLRKEARPGDLILVAPFYYGVSLQRYFDSNQWTTLPPMEEIRIHRYDLAKKAMLMADPVGPSLAKARTSLVSGHTFWVVGEIPRPDKGGPAPPLDPPFTGTMSHVVAAKYDSDWRA